MRVKIGPIRFAIQYVEDLHDQSRNLDGWIRHTSSKILIEKSLGKQRKRLVLWHEIIHAIMTHGGCEDHDETLVDIIAGGVMSVLNENKWLREMDDAA